MDKILERKSIEELLILSKHFQVDINLPIVKLFQALNSKLVKRGTMPGKVNISNKGILSLSEYFSTYSGDINEITELDCSGNKLTSLVGCPPNVKKLNCNNNLLENLIGCPENAEYIFCSNNKLTSLKGAPKVVGALIIDDNPKLLSSIWNSEKFNDEIQYIPSSMPILEKLFKRACEENNLEKATIVANHIQFKSFLMSYALQSGNKAAIIKMLKGFGVPLPLRTFDKENNETSAITKKLIENGVPLHEEGGYIYIEQGVPDTAVKKDKRHYKIHLQPKQNTKEKVVMRLVELFSIPDISKHIITWKYALLDPNQLLKAASGGALEKLFPSIVVYPQVNVEAPEIVLNTILKAFPDADELGFNLTPRYNIRVNALVYYAGGDGDYKEGEPELFDDKKQLYKDQLPLLMEQEFLDTENTPIIRQDDPQRIRSIKKRSRIISIRKVKTSSEPRKRSRKSF